MTNFEKWVQSCEEQGIEMWELEKQDDTSLYKIYSKYEYKNNVYLDIITYHIWKNDRNVLTTQNYIDAYKAWERVLNES